MSTVTIRPVEARDAEALYQAWEALRAHNAALDARIVPVPVSREEFAAAVTDIASRAASRTFLAESDGELAGFITGAVEHNQPDRLPERHVTIGYFYVDPAFRRQGIGQRLFEAIGQWASAQPGIAHVEMAVLACDQSAERFWRAAGFSPFITRVWAPLPTPGAR